jgi:hypothetical protein
MGCRSRLRRLARLALLPAISLPLVYAARVETHAQKDGAGARPPNVTGAIEGQVVDENGQPVAHVPVNISARVSGGVQRPSNMLATDEEGKFRVNNLEAGVYSVWAPVPGYVPESNADGPRYYRLGDVVALRMTKGGVITGTVMDQNGHPVVAAHVRAFIVRELDGTSPREGQTPRGGRDFRTDDRGVYRLYGLDTGVYVVSVAGFTQWGSDEAPTYFPSSTRDTAAEITVRAGQETAGVDIRYRGERGRSISGMIAGATDSGTDFTGTTVSLIHAQSGTFTGNAYVTGRDGDRGFAFEGVADGDYELVARRLERDGSASASQPQRVSVRGADVTGLKLTLAPLASVSGTVVFEPLPEGARAASGCIVPPQNILPQEILVSARRAGPAAQAKDQPRSRALRSEAAPDAQGAFKLRNLDAGRLRIEARALPDGFYLRSVVIPAAAQAVGRQRAPLAPRQRRKAAATVAPPPSSHDSLVVASGQQLTGVRVVLAEGAAGVSGRVGGDEGALPTLDARLRVHLVPAERADADDVLRYAESTVNTDGAFALTNLAPGRYWIVARVASGEHETAESFTRPLAWETEARAGLRREAEAAGLSIVLQPCQRRPDLTLRSPPISQ